MRSIRIASVVLTLSFCLPIFADEPAQDVTLENLFGPSLKIDPRTAPPVPTSHDPLDSLFESTPNQSTAKPATKPVSEDDGVSKAELLRRIEQLEKRLAEMEAKQSRTPQVLPPTVNPDQHKFYGPPSQPPQVVPQPPRRNHAVPPPIGPPSEAVSPNWKKFHFNGEDYYYIPVKDVPRLLPST